MLVFRFFKYFLVKYDFLIVTICMWISNNMFTRVAIFRILSVKKMRRHYDGTETIAAVSPFENGLSVRW